MKNQKLPSKNHDLVFNEPIRRWDEALPLGNGLTGCLVWGNGDPLVLSLDRGDLWDTRLVPEVQGSGFTYRNLIELVRNEDQQQIRSRFNNFFMTYPNPTKLPAGRIEFQGENAAETIVYRLHLREAKAEVNWIAGGADYQLESFLHAENGLGYIRLQGEHIDAINLKLTPPAYTDSSIEEASKSSSLDLSLASLGYPKAEFGSEGDSSWFYQRTNHELEYAIVVAKRSVSERTIEWVYTVAANLDGEDWFDQAKSKVKAAAQIGFDEALLAHTAWWEKFWLQSTLTLSEFEIEKQWYLTNYLFGSCSRKGAPPMPLQGVWTADEGQLPPWKGDYHHDLNTELSYWHYLKANHLQEGESFLDFLWNLRPAAREFAQNYFESSGINLPSVMTINGKPLGGWPMYSLSPTNQIWLCQAFDQYWLYTGDREFLETKAYIYMKETALCLLDLLLPGEDGILRLPVSSSPEIHDDSLQSWLTPNSNFDLSLLRYLFGRLTELAELLKEKADHEKWTAVLKQLPELAVNDTGLMLSPDESLKVSHRHLSHAMAIYPLRMIDYRGSERDKEIIDHTISHLEILGKGLWVGYTFAWMAALYTRQGNGEAARYHLQQFWNYMCSPNGFHLNGDYRNTGVTVMHYRPFTLEGNMAAVDALQEMLLQTDHGMIRPFPAVPKEWLQNGAEFHQFRGEMGVLVSAKAISGELQYVELLAEREGMFQLENRFPSELLQLEKPESVVQTSCPKGCVVSIHLKKGERCRITSI
ncbi:glycoside hydrolase family 95 protein [Paenibacillus sp. KQZ6P-2]|uniref:Glycoside hydrolase family 95 protein n=1 Tax=Paenibacillus mangrovi TaxID=2931978 RepID=A0A9X1WPF5_9BACL|nr:glycoside hydrolase N-terminal domain-containing protein [Paenibacillus mangrovi]MCJ8012654.1 glycoside hydrolase family 95 protein [Paenibacillus mangrovi]